MLVNVIQHGSVAVNLQQVLKFPIHEHGYIGSGRGSKFQAVKSSCQISALLGVEGLTVSTSIGHFVKHEQGTIFPLAPIEQLYHIAFLFTPDSTGLQKTEVA